MRIPFGKFTDEEIDDLPRWYLDWLSQQKWMREKFPRLADAVRLRLEDLDAGNDDAPTTGLTRDVFKSWRRAMLAKWHPDAPTGSHAGFVAVSDAIEALSSMLATRGVSA